jgi:hypothetical protein
VADPVLYYPEHRPFSHFFSPPDHKIELFVPSAWLWGERLLCCNTTGWDRQTPTQHKHIHIKCTKANAKLTHRTISITTQHSTAQHNTTTNICLACLTPPPIATSSCCVFVFTLSYLVDRVVFVKRGWRTWTRF